MRKAHPLLGTFPLTVMAVAVLLIAFAFAMARASHAKDSDLPSALGASALHAVSSRSR